jgi:hypothetical protein
MVIIEHAFDESMNSEIMESGLMIRDVCIERADLSVFKYMGPVSHRGHREHREIILSSVLSVTSVAIFPYGNRHNGAKVFDQRAGFSKDRLK